MSPQALPNGLPPWAQLHVCLDSLDAEVLTVEFIPIKLQMYTGPSEWF